MALFFRGVSVNSTLVRCGRFACEATRRKAAEGEEIFPFPIPRDSSVEVNFDLFNLGGIHFESEIDSDEQQAG